MNPKHAKSTTMSQAPVILEPFTERDFATLIGWISNERELLQFAGPVFKFPLDAEQLRVHLSDKNRHSFNIVLTENNQVIGHCEAYRADEESIRLCRILIGRQAQRGQGLGYEAVAQLMQWCMQNYRPKSIDLNVFDFNTSAIRCYEKLGFLMTDEQKTCNLNGEVWTAVKMVFEPKYFP